MADDNSQQFFVLFCFILWKRKIIILINKKDTLMNYLKSDHAPVRTLFALNQVTQFIHFYHKQLLFKIQLIRQHYQL